MPNIKSAKKRVKQSATRAMQNEKYELAVKKGMKKVSKASKAEVKKMVGEMDSNIQKASKKGIIHKNKAARLQSKVSKLAL